MNQGYVHIYTGNGKGKTTAALGLALRAAGAGMGVFIAQFLKKGQYSEHKALGCFSGWIRVEQFGTGRFVRGNPGPEDRAAAAKGMDAARAAMGAGKYDLLILDEAVTAAAMGCLPEDGLLELILHKPKGMELVLTGRGAGDRLVDAADLVTEMKERKHYYKTGVPARAGIEK